VIIQKKSEVSGIKQWMQSNELQYPFRKPALPKIGQHHLRQVGFMLNNTYSFVQ